MTTYDELMSELFSGQGWRVALEKATLPDGRTTEDVRVQRSDALLIIACIDNDHVILLREFQAHWNTYTWNLPGGKLDKETDMLTGAQRELREEAGYKAGSLEHLWDANVSDILNFTHHFFVGKNLSKDPLPQDLDELIEVHICTFKEALEKVESSKRVHLPSAYALRRWIMERKYIINRPAEVREPPLTNN